MVKIIPGVYEQGVIRPLKKLPFFNHQRVELQINIPKTHAEATKAIIRVSNKIGKLIAGSPHFSSLEA